MDAEKQAGPSIHHLTDPFCKLTPSFSVTAAVAEQQAGPGLREVHSNETSAKAWARVVFPKA